MSELNKWIPREGTDDNRSPKPVSRTNWGDAPEHLRPLLDTWETATGLKFLKDRKYQIKCAHEWYNEFGGDTELVKDAYYRLRDSGYNYKSLSSIHSTARTIRGKQRDPDSVDERRKYLKGWYDDD